MNKPANWKWENGIGFLPLGPNPVAYDRKYFDNYTRLGQTNQGRLITLARTHLVSTWVMGNRMVVLDVGIGAGFFVQRMRSLHWECYGTDVNEAGIQWLKQRGWLWLPKKPYQVLTMWDVLEHIEDPEELISPTVEPCGPVPTWIFVSTPIYENEEHALRSKHFKPGEHCWYFTKEGLIAFMESLQYRCVEWNCREVIQGNREDIGTFVFNRIS